MNITTTTTTTTTNNNDTYTTNNTNANNTGLQGNPLPVPHRGQLLLERRLEIIVDFHVSICSPMCLACSTLK